MKGFAAAGSFGGNGRAIGILSHAGNAGGEAHVGVGKGLQSLDAHASEFVLFGLNDKRIRRLVAQHFVIELDDLGARRLVPKLKVARHQTLLDELVDEADASDHFESRGMGGRRPGIVVDLVFGFEQGHRVPALRARQGRDHAHRTAAGDDDAGVIHDHATPKYFRDCPWIGTCLTSQRNAKQSPEGRTGTLYSRGRGRRRNYCFAL